MAKAPLSEKLTDIIAIYKKRSTKAEKIRESFREDWTKTLSGLKTSMEVCKKTLEKEGFQCQIKEPLDTIEMSIMTADKSIPQSQWPSIKFVAEDPHVKITTHTAGAEPDNRVQLVSTLTAENIEEIVLNFVQTNLNKWIPSWVK